MERLEQLYQMVLKRGSGNNFREHSPSPESVLKALARNEGYTAKEVNAYLRQKQRGNR